MNVRVCHAYTLDMLAIEQHFEINARQTKPSQNSWNDGKWKLNSLTIYPGTSVTQPAAILLILTNE